MSPHDYTWLLFAMPAAVALLGAVVYVATGLQDRIGGRGDR
jgi:cytochrome c-type biogenesis protein CcmH/NrfF